MYKHLVKGLCLFSLTMFTGCLDEVIERLCEEISESANTVTVSLNSNPDLTNKNLIVVYTNSTAQSITFTDCEGDFEGTKGSLSNSGGNLAITNILSSSSARDFFLDENGEPTSEQFSVEISTSDVCDAAESLVASGSSQLPIWEDLSNEVSTEQCPINAYAGALSASSL